MLFEKPAVDFGSAQEEVSVYYTRVTQGAWTLLIILYADRLTEENEEFHAHWGPPLGLEDLHQDGKIPSPLYGGRLDEEDILEVKLQFVLRRTIHS